MRRCRPKGGSPYTAWMTVTVGHGESHVAIRLRRQSSPLLVGEAEFQMKVGGGVVVPWQDWRPFGWGLHKAGFRRSRA